MSIGNVYQWTPCNKTMEKNMRALRYALMASTILAGACLAPETGAATNSTADTSPIVVTKQGAEGSITVDRVTGVILTKTDERPEWADGLATALLSEHAGFYSSRLGHNAYDASFKLTDTATFQDLGWIGVDQEGLEVEMEADQEYRMQAIADYLGIDREGDGEMDNVLAEAEMDTDNIIGMEDQKALTAELEQTEFVRAEEAEGARAQGGSKD